jgi:peptidoglycan hydrolase CwlO-like protein
MGNRIKFISAVLVLFVIFGCGFLKDKVNEKVNEEIDEQMEEVNKEIKENQRKVDSIMNSTNFDSLQNELDSLMKDLDKTGVSIDSLEKELNKKK